MRINALGTIYVNEEFTKVMGAKSCIIDVASMAGHMMPDLYPMQLFYRLALKNEEAFVKAAVGMFKAMPAKLQPGAAYSISKNFDIWYAKYYAMQVSDQGIRVLSVSPGDFATPMGNLEKADAENFLPKAALKRFGDPDEMACLLTGLAAPDNGYMTAIDVLCDSGVSASMKLNPLYSLKVTLKSGLGVLKG